MLDRSRDIPYCGVREDVIASATPMFNTKILDYLYEFVVDRYTVRYNKDVLKKEAPWTDNPIFQQVKFTNVRREHDRQSRYLIDNIASQTQYSLKDRCFNIMLMRFWNKIESWNIATGGQLLKFPLSDDDYSATCERIYAGKGHVFWSNAYYTSPVRNWKQRKYKDKSELDSGYADSPVFFAKEFFTDELWQKMVDAESPKALFELLKSLPCMGDFICYQWFVDFTYCEDFWFSENHYTVSGPGCTKGINLLFADRNEMTHEECLFWLRDNQHVIFEQYGYDPKELFKDLPEHDRYINLMSFENLMCELQKYIKCKAQLVEGKKPRAKSNYNGVGVKQVDLFDLSL